MYKLYEYVFLGFVCLVLVLLCSILCPFQFCNHLDGDERESWLFYINCLPDVCGC